MTNNENNIHQAISYSRYILTWAGLLAFTCATVIFSGIELGKWVVVTALAIAGAKSILVLNIFMHLKFEDRIFRIFVLVAFITFMIFIFLTFADYAFH
jgi:cytochrome c oxidase subunit 4